MRYSETKFIKNQTRKISREKLDFKGGVELGDVDIFIDGGVTRKKVRRIVEKRVCQEYWKQAGSANDNYSRYRTRHHLSNHLKNIYGSVPTGFRLGA
jgi:hypothetical protein